MSLRRKLRFVVLTGLVFTWTFANAHNTYPNLFSRDCLIRIQFLGSLPGHDTNRFLLADVNDGLKDARNLMAAVNRRPELLFAAETYGALADYGRAVSPHTDLDNPRPSDLAAITRAAFDARLRIMKAAGAALRTPIHDWTTYVTIVHVFLQTQKFIHGPANMKMVGALKRDLSEWPDIFEAMLLTATPEMQTYLVDDVFRLEFIPPNHIFAMEARKIVADAYRAGKLHASVVARLSGEPVARLWMAEYQNRGFSSVLDSLSGKYDVRPLTVEERKLWDRESLRVVPEGISGYLETQINSIEDFVSAFGKLKAAKRPSLQLKDVPDGLDRQLMLLAVRADTALVKSYERLRALIGGILTGRTHKVLKDFESWETLISALEDGHRTSFIHPTFSEFQIKLLADLIKVGRDHFPMTLDQSRRLYPLFNNASYRTSDHPAITELAELVVADAAAFAPEARLSAVQYLLAHSERSQKDQLEALRDSIIKTFPPVTAKRASFPGASVYWQSGNEDLGESIRAPYLDVWLYQQGSNGADLSSCEFLLM